MNREYLSEVTTWSSRPPARIEQERLPWKLLDLNEMIQADNLIIEPWTPKGITFKIVLASRVSPILADEKRVRQVIADLLIHATLLMAVPGRTENRILTLTTGTETIKADASSSAFVGHRTLVPGTYTALSVSNTAPTMDKIEADIWHPSSCEQTVADTFSPTGLMPVLQTVLAHKGGMQVYSQPGKGILYKTLWPAAQNVGLANRSRQKTISLR